MKRKAKAVLSYLIRLVVRDILKRKGKRHADD